MIAPPVIRPSRNGGCRIERFDSSSGLKPLVSATMMEKIMVVAPTTAVPISTGLAVALNVLPAPSFSSRLSLPLIEIGGEAEIFLDFAFDSGNLFDGGKLEYRLRVVGHRTVGIHRDGHRAHAQESERDQAEGEYRRRHHEVRPDRSVLTQ